MPAPALELRRSGSALADLGSSHTRALGRTAGVGRDATDDGKHRDRFLLTHERRDLTAEIALESVEVCFGARVHGCRANLPCPDASAQGRSDDLVSDCCRWRRGEPLQLFMEAPRQRTFVGPLAREGEQRLELLDAKPRAVAGRAFIGYGQRGARCSRSRPLPCSLTVSVSATGRFLDSSALWRTVS